MEERSKSEEVSASKDQLELEIEEFLEAYLPKPGTVVAESPKVVHDGLWGTVRLDPAEICFLDTPLLQRLRQIHQTGCSYLTYPSTTHSRFEHTLGVMLQVQKLGEALIKYNPRERRLSTSDIQQIRFAALFHDLGHGPFSHASEEIYGIYPIFDSIRPENTNPNPHEILTYYILKSPRFKEYCQRISSDYQVPIPLDEIANYIIGSKTDFPFKRELINGPFDADKLDYLFRDSHFSGLPLSVDLDRLFYTVRLAEVKGETRLVVTHSGATPLEQILFSKMVLFTSVYQHHKVRASECMFAGIIEYMKEKNIPMKIKNKELKWASPIDFLWITDAEILSFGFETDYTELHDLIHNLFFRRLLKRALIISLRTIELQEGDRWIEFQRHAKKNSYSSKVRRDLAREIWERAGHPCLLQEIWVDLPQLPNLKAAEDTFVLPAEVAGVVPVSLNDLFPTGIWAHQYGLNKWRGHVFCPPHLRKPVGRAAKEVLEEKFGIRILPEAFLWCKVDPPAD
jgi:HD superfamily phosphohydrolase